MRYRVLELRHRMKDGAILRWRMCRLMFCGITLIVRDADGAVLSDGEEWRLCSTSLASCKTKMRLYDEWDS